MRSFFEQLTPEQQKAALEYDGPENHGDDAFKIAATLPGGFMPLPMTDRAEPRCELCGVPFADDYIRAEIGRKRYCSPRCQKKAGYIRRRDKVLEGLRTRRETDPAWREQQIQKDRDWREANRKEDTGRRYRPR